MFWILTVIEVVLFFTVPLAVNEFRPTPHGSDHIDYTVGKDGLVYGKLTPAPPAPTPFSIPLPFLLGAVALTYGACGIQIVTQWERRPVLRLGKYTRTLGPGMQWMDPIIHRALDDESIQDAADEEQVEGIQTHDNVPISFSLVMTYCIQEKDVERWVTSVEDGITALWRRAIATASECVGNSELDSILHDRDPLHDTIEKTLRSRVSQWGVTIRACELKDVSIMDPAIASAIAMKAKAKKEGEAELVRAKIQEAVAAELTIAAQLYSPAALHLKGLETLVELCRSGQNNTVLIPTDILQGLKGLLDGGGKG